MTTLQDVPVGVPPQRRSEEGNIFLPNVSIATWFMEKRDDRFIQSLWSVDLLSQTPLHYTAQEGSLEAAKLLLEFTSVSIDRVDGDGKRAVDLALEGDFHDVYPFLKSLFNTISPSNGGRCQLSERYKDETHWLPVSRTWYCRYRFYGWACVFSGIAASCRR
jgi:hypothetical protein